MIHPIRWFANIWHVIYLASAAPDRMMGPQEAAASRRLTQDVYTFSLGHRAGLDDALCRSARPYKPHMIMQTRSVADIMGSPS